MTTATQHSKPRRRPDTDEMTVAQAARHLAISRQRIGQKLVEGIPGARKIAPPRGHSFWVLPVEYVRQWRTGRIDAGFTVGPPVTERKANVV